jgi:hypothetical protein
LSRFEEIVVNFALKKVLLHWQLEADEIERGGRERERRENERKRS